MGNSWVVMCLDRVGRVDTFEELSFKKSPNELRDRKMFRKK